MEQYIHMFRNKTSLLIGSVILIFVAMAVVSIIDRTKSSSSTDVRARASGTNTLQFNGTFSAVDPETGTLIVNDLFMADTSRAGEAKNLGTWTVTPPANFNAGSLAPNTKIVIGIDPKTFLAQSHSLTALSITTAK